MRRLVTLAFITVYLGALVYGNLCHAVGHGTGSHPLMYFIVWDMFCGWAAYDSRTHIVAQGENQKFYELAPAPWGEIRPWGSLGRHHYDGFNSHSGRIALNTLRHSAHEPIERVFVIEECWAKKFNLPDSVWKSRYDAPRDPYSYYRLRSEFAVVDRPPGSIPGSIRRVGDAIRKNADAKSGGDEHNPEAPALERVRNQGSWLAHQSLLTVWENPRLQQDAEISREMFLRDGQLPGEEASPSPGLITNPLLPPVSPVGAPLGR
ncbi:MAG: hypothetical protein ACT4QC_01335 [Planctomycetaceae bacterium]